MSTELDENHCEVFSFSNLKSQKKSSQNSIMKSKSESLFKSTNNKSSNKSIDKSIDKSIHKSTIQSVNKSIISTSDNQLNQSDGLFFNLTSSLNCNFSNSHNCTHCTHSFKQCGNLIQDKPINDSIYLDDLLTIDYPDCALNSYSDSTCSNLFFHCSSHKINLTSLNLNKCIFNSDARHCSDSNDNKSSSKCASRSSAIDNRFDQNQSDYSVIKQNQMDLSNNTKSSIYSSNQSSKSSDKLLNSSRSSNHQFNKSSILIKQFTSYSKEIINLSRYFSNYQTLLVPLLLLCTFIRISDACSARSTPKPRPPLPEIRPNITFQTTYQCPGAYAKWYCLNGATCFFVRIGESILYNCECADGYMGQRCEFKDLEGSYLQSREKVLVETAQVAGGFFTLLVVFVFIALIFFQSYNKRKSSRTMSEHNQLPFIT